MSDTPSGTGDVQLFKSSNEEAAAVTALTYKVVERSPFRLILKDATHTSEVPPGAEYDPSVLATACTDAYLMSLSGSMPGSGPSGPGFKWDKETEWGVDCASGVDPLLVLAAVITA